MSALLHVAVGGGMLLAVVVFDFFVADRGATWR